MIIFFFEYTLTKSIIIFIVATKIIIGWVSGEGRGEFLTDKRMKARGEAVLPLHSKMGQEILKKTSGELATE